MVCMSPPAAVPAPPVPAPPAAGLVVLYDGACPLCRREIGIYRGLAGSEPLCFADVSDPAQPLPAGMRREALLARFHVQRADGRLLDGAQAFVALWATLPGWRWLARLAALPGMTALMERAYRGFLVVRPLLQRAARRLEPRSAGAVPADLVADLRSDHAGETGAVWIYRGILAVARDDGVRAFAQAHLGTEQRHLALIEDWLPEDARSRLLGPWRLAGWLTGALPALCGPRAVYATIAAVETFVDRHYQQQIDRLAGRPADAALRALLVACQSDERRHRDEAAAAAAPGAAPPGGPLRAWCALVAAGSSAAVALARRL